MLLSLTFKSHFFPASSSKARYTLLILSQTYLHLTNFAHEASSWNCLQLNILPTSTSFILHGAALNPPPVSNLSGIIQTKSNLLAKYLLAFLHYN